MLVCSPPRILQGVSTLGGCNKPKGTDGSGLVGVVDVLGIKEGDDTRARIVTEMGQAAIHGNRAAFVDEAQDLKLDNGHRFGHRKHSFRPDSITEQKENARERGEDLEEKKMTRAEKIETLKILAGMTEEQKSIFVIGVLLGEHKAKFGAQVKTEAQTA